MIEPFAKQPVRPYDLNKAAHLRKIPKRRPGVGPGREGHSNDIFRQLNIDPRFEAENVALMNDYITAMGKIRTRPVTSLSQRSQRLVGKAIKRARSMGIISRFFRMHPKDIPSQRR